MANGRPSCCALRRTARYPRIPDAERRGPLRVLRIDAAETRGTPAGQAASDWIGPPQTGMESDAGKASVRPRQAALVASKTQD